MPAEVFCVLGVECPRSGRTANGGGTIPFTDLRNRTIVAHKSLRMICCHFRTSRSISNDQQRHRRCHPVFHRRIPRGLLCWLLQHRRPVFRHYYRPTVELLLHSRLLVPVLPRMSLRWHTIQFRGRPFSGKLLDSRWQAYLEYILGSRTQYT